MGRRISLEERKRRKSERSKAYRMENRERISAKRHEYYVQNQTEIKARVKQYYDNMTEEQRQHRREKRRDYLEQNPQVAEDLRKRRQVYYLENREALRKKQRQYYDAHREEIREYITGYLAQNAEKIKQQRAQYKVVRHNALAICPAFKFTELIRLKYNDVFLTKYKRYAKLDNTASKKCAAIQTGDFRRCPICRNIDMSVQEMQAVCPMPRVFEFQDAYEQIQKYARTIVLCKPRVK